MTHKSTKHAFRQLCILHTPAHHKQHSYNCAEYKVWGGAHAYPIMLIVKGTRLRRATHTRGAGSNLPDLMEKGARLRLRGWHMRRSCSYVQPESKRGARVKPNP